MARVVSTTVAACFYGDLRSFGRPVSEDGEVAFRAWRELARDPTIGSGPPDGFTDLARDIEGLGVEAFAEAWHFLVAEHRTEPARLRRQLDQTLGERVDAGLRSLDEKQHATVELRTFDPERVTGPSVTLRRSR